MKLKGLAFHITQLNVQWITVTLQTVESKDLQRVTIYSHAPFPTQIEDTISRAWRDLDRLLVQFWTSRAIRPKITYEMGKEGSDLRDLAPFLLPGLTKKGVVRLIRSNRQLGRQ